MSINERPSIVLMTNGRERAGTEEHVLDVGRSLVNRGYGVIAIVADRPDIHWLGEELRAAGATVHDVPERSGRLGSLTRVRDLRRLLHLYPGALLHLQFNGHPSGELTMIAARLAGMRRIVRTDHNPPIADAGWKERLSLRIRDLFLSDIIVMSEQDRAAYIAFGRDARKLRVIPHGIHVSRFGDPVERASVRREMGIDADAAATLIEDGSLRRSMASAGHAVVTQRHTTEVMVDAIVAVYEAPHRRKALLPAFPAAERGVSVVVPTRDRPHYLTHALESIAAVEERLGSSLPIEVIVVDNSSSVGLSAEARLAATERGARFIESSPAGVSRARNAGIRAARYDLVAFLDDDDAFLPAHIAPMVAVLDSRPEVALVFGQQFLCDSELEPVFGPVPDAQFPDGEAFAFSMNTIVQWNSAVTRRSVLLELGGFDEKIHMSEDWDLQMRLAARYDMVGVEVPVALLRQHERPLQSYEGWKAYIRLCARVEWRGAFLRTRRPVGPILRLFGRRQLRGQSAYNALVHARRHLELGDRGEARRFVLGAFRRSPPHTVKLVWQMRGDLAPLVAGSRARRSQ